MSEGELILYGSEAGRTKVHLRADGRTVWLTQAEMAELFATKPQAITQLLATIYGDGELSEAATCKEFLQVRREGAPDVRRNLKHYNLEAILAVGFAADQARRRKTITMADWLARLDAFLEFNERAVLDHAGTIQMKVAEALAHEHYEAFDIARRQAEALAADAEDIAALDALGKRAPGGGV